MLAFGGEAEGVVVLHGVEFVREAYPILEVD
jgi:hypothetical protein